MASVVILGGGLAGLSAAAALASAGHQIQVLEGRPFLGGRATSYEAPGEIAETIDNCQHILLRCCVNLLDFYKRLGVENEIQFHKEFVFIEPGGRRSLFKAGALPTPAHFAESFLHLTFLNWSEKLAVARAIQNGRGADDGGVVLRLLTGECRGDADDGEPILDLFHARFPFAWREAIELRVRRRFGAPGRTVANPNGEHIPVRRPHRAVLVATQVVEQSLDLDFDLLVTESAPGDRKSTRLNSSHVALSRMPSSA